MDDNITLTNDASFPGLPENLQDDFITLIHERVGVLVKRNHKELIKAVKTICNESAMTPVEYLEALKKAEDNSVMLGRLVSAITIGETYFFRDKNQMKILAEKILPEIINKKRAMNQKTLRIWSAGCSSGDEIFSIVMLLAEALPDIDQWQCNLLATDINVDVLKKGLSGNFNQWAMRSIPEHFLSKYFKRNGNSYEVSHNIKNKVTFEYLNLINDAYPSILNGTMMQDLILCRNVLIYFDNNHIKTIIHRLSQCLSDDGYLMLGASDPVFMQGEALMPANSIPSLFRKKLNIVPEIKTAPVIIETYSPPVSVTRPASVEHVSEKPRHEVKVSPEVAAMSLANQGKIMEAIKLCERSIQEDKTNKEIYFIYALSLAENKQPKDAETAFRKAIFLDSDYVIARYQFGLFLIRMNKINDGIKSLHNAMDAAGRLHAEEVVPNSQNITYGQLITIIKNEIELHQ